MGKLSKNLIGRRFFDNLPTVHHHDPLTGLGDNPEIMGHHNGCHPKFILKLFHLLQHLSLGGDIRAVVGSSAMSNEG